MLMGVLTESEVRGQTLQHGGAALSLLALQKTDVCLVKNKNMHIRMKPYRDDTRLYTPCQSLHAETSAYSKWNNTQHWRVMYLAL